MLLPIVYGDVPKTEILLPFAANRGPVTVLEPPPDRPFGLGDNPLSREDSGTGPHCCTRDDPRHPRQLRGRLYLDVETTSLSVSTSNSESEQ